MSSWRSAERCGVQPYETGVLPDEPCTIFAEMETGRLPEEEDISALVDRLSGISDRGLAQGKEQGLNLIDFMVRRPDGLCPYLPV